MKVEGEIREEFRSDISIRPAIMLVANCTEQVKGWINLLTILIITINGIRE